MYTENGESSSHLASLRHHNFVAVATIILMERQDWGSMEVALNVHVNGLKCILSLTTQPTTTGQTGENREWHRTTRPAETCVKLKIQNCHNKKSSELNYWRNLSSGERGGTLVANEWLQSSSAATSIESSILSAWYRMPSETGMEESLFLFRFNVQQSEREGDNARK